MELLAFVQLALRTVLQRKQLAPDSASFHSFASIVESCNSWPDKEQVGELKLVNSANATLERLVLSDGSEPKPGQAMTTKFQ